jgi:hypothetical protein
MILTLINYQPYIKEGGKVEKPLLKLSKMTQARAIVLAMQF